MSRKQKTIHYLYKTTCKVTGRYYIGMHSTSNLEDGYMGSGKRLRYSIRKHGKDNHEKEILELFESRELLIEAEKKAITPEMLVDVMCMNLRGGGSGGFVNIQHKNAFQKAGSIIGLKVIKERIKNDEIFRNIWIEKRKECWKNMTDDIRKNALAGLENYRGTKHSNQTKKLISEKMSLNGLGEKNSQYGTMWITNGVKNKKIKKEDGIPKGWYKGRK